jgi:hypothetical protein
MSGNEANSFVPPNYTQIPNAFWSILPQMSEAELKVSLVIARETFGWHRQQKEMSLSYLMKATGLSRQSVINGTEAGIERGTIYKRESGNSFAYGLAIQEIEPQVVQNLDQSEISTSPKFRPAVVQNLDRLEPQVVQNLDTTNKEREIKSKKRLSPDGDNAQADASHSLACGKCESQDVTPLKSRDGNYGTCRQCNARVELKAVLSVKPTRGAQKKPPTQSDPRSSHPAIQAVRELTGYFPAKLAYDDVIATLGEHFDMGKLRACAVAWSKVTKNMMNLTWLFEWYVSGIPSKNGGNGNGQKRVVGAASPVPGKYSRFNRAVPN